jgi:hypothetical protein
VEPEIIPIKPDPGNAGVGTEKETTRAPVTTGAFLLKIRALWNYIPNWFTGSLFEE